MTAILPRFAFARLTALVVGMYCLLALIANALGAEPAAPGCCAAACKNTSPLLSPMAHIRAVSVSLTVDGRFAGSGTVFERAGETIVVTAAHILTDGAPIRVTQPGADNGNPGTLSLVAEVVTVDEARDLAILSVGAGVFQIHARMPCRCGKTCRCDPCRCRPPLDTPIIHCGSMSAQHQTVTRGYVVGFDRQRFRDGQKLDQADLTAWCGSSGGGVFDTAGNYIGMVTRGENHGHITYYVPVRAMADLLGTAPACGGMPPADE